MLQALLVALWAGICAVDDVGTQMLRRPLLICPVVGLIMGDLPSSLLIGATLEIMWMGVGNVGAYSAPDMISGSCIGCALGLAAGSGATEVAVALAVPTSLLAQQLIILYKSGITALNPMADKIAESGDFSKVYNLVLGSAVIAFLVRAVPTFLAIYLGAGVIDTVVAALPANIMSGLNVAGKIVPAVGIALLMQMMLKKADMWVFLIAGFALSVYLGLAVLPVALISLPLAVIYDMAASRPQAPVAASNEEGDLDL